MSHGLEQRNEMKREGLQELGGGEGMVGMLGAEV